MNKSVFVGVHDVCSFARDLSHHQKTLSVIRHLSLRRQNPFSLQFVNCCNQEFDIFLSLQCYSFSEDVSFTCPYHWNHYHFYLSFSFTVLIDLYCQMQMQLSFFSAAFHSLPLKTHKHLILSQLFGLK